MKPLFLCAWALAAMTLVSCGDKTPIDDDDDPIVQPVAVESVELDKSVHTLEEGKTLTLKATVLPENADNKKVTWSSDKEAVATVEEGVVTAVAAGEAKITVTTEDGGKTAVCVITVEKGVVPVTGVMLEPEVYTLQMGETETVTLTATVLPAEADNKTVTWENSNPDAAAIETDGFTCTVTAVAEGETVITVKSEDGNLDAVCTVTVLKAVTPPPTHAKTTTMWEVAIDGGVQLWSDAIQVPACNKEDFNGNNADCRSWSDTNGTYYYYSGAYLTDNAAVLCPEPWSIPTVDDFDALDKALGGTGQEQKNTTLRDAYLDAAKWGGGYGGYASNYGMYQQGTAAWYWSQTPTGSSFHALNYTNDGTVRPKASSTMSYARLVRCVKR